MLKDKDRVPDHVATGARKFLRLFVIFFLGFIVAHLDSVQRIENGASTGELADAVLSNPHDSYDTQVSVKSRVPHALAGGAVFIGPEFSKDLVLLLVGEQGTILHRWSIENGAFNPELKAWWKNLPDGKESSIDDARLLPNGDVVFIQLMMSVNNYRGERLARMDSASHILWQVPGNFHHFIHIGGSPQKIYTLTSRLRTGFPEVAAANNRIRYLDDCIAVYSLEGKKIDEWSLADAFAHSPYHDWLSSFEVSVPLVQRITQPDGRVLYDLFHTNSVQYLDARKAKALPFAREGDILVSFRMLSALAVFRPSTQQIVWAVKGPFRHQHDAEVGDDGKLYVYDNDGKMAVTLYSQPGPPEQYVSRLICFDPFTNRLEEIYASPALYSYFLGNYAPLPDGAWVISSAMHGSVYVVSSAKEVVWELHTVPAAAQAYVPHRKQISFMHYYPPAMLDFLDADKSAAKPQP